MRRWVAVSLFAPLTFLAAGYVAYRLSDGLQWRVKVVVSKARGELETIPLTNLITWIKPGSPTYIGGLAEVPNPHAQIRNLFSDEKARSSGQEVFQRRCGLCHDEARGTESLERAMVRKSDWHFFSATKWGIAGTGMTAQPLTDLEIWQVHAYLRGKLIESSERDGGLDDAERRGITVAPAEIVAAGPLDEWLTYGGNYAATRHSQLSKINARNAHTLGLKWTVQLRQRNTPNQSSPIVAGGVIYLSESTEGVVALDAKTGRKLWQYERPVPDDLPLCCGTPNRGTAILGDMVFVTSLDNHLIAIDATTGRQRWIRKVANHEDGYTMTGAPLALKDRVVIGVAGGEYGIRGFVAAFRASDGEPLWRFNTVPGPGEPGGETWSGDSWKTGGAPTWTVGSYDSELNLVYWGTGNPAPDFRADLRRGDNLYSNCLIALDAETGRLAWHYQLNPADEYDWDAVQQPVQAEIDWEGRRTPVVMLASKNGFFYALNRKTGAFLYAKPFARQTWNAGFDESGRPTVRDDARPSAKGTLVAPTAGGAANWWPLSYDSGRQLMFVPSVDASALFFRGDVTFTKGEPFLGSTSAYAANVPVAAAIRAIDVRTGEVRWQALLEEGGANVVRAAGGVLSTRGGVFFAGYKEQFSAFDSDSGRKLWSVGLGARVSGPPVAFTVDGEQRIAVTAGSAVYIFGLP